MVLNLTLYRNSNIERNAYLFIVDHNPNVTVEEIFTVNQWFPNFFFHGVFMHNRPKFTYYINSELKIKIPKALDLTDRLMNLNYSSFLPCQGYLSRRCLTCWNLLRTAGSLIWILIVLIASERSCFFVVPKWPFFTADSLTFHSRKGTGGTDRIPFFCKPLPVLVTVAMSVKVFPS